MPSLRVARMGHARNAGRVKKNCMGVWKMSTHYTCGCPSAICNGFKTPRCDYQYTMLKGGKLNLENWEAA